MNDAENRAGVNAAVQSLPAFAAKAANPGGARSECKRNQKDKSGKADGDERALDNVLEHSRKAERLIGAEVGEEVQADVEEGEETEHAAEADEFRKMEEFAERSDAKSEDEKTQCPIAGLMLVELDGIGGEVVASGAQGDP